MAFVALAVGGLAVAGAVGGAMKSGPDMNMYGREQAQGAYDAYKNLVGKGPGEQDVTKAYDASKQYADLLGVKAGTGLYDSRMGNKLAEQQFAPQRQALAQSLQDQMALANRQANAAGRSSNDPILKARLGAEAMRMKATLNSQQYGAAMDLGRQNTMDTLNLGGQRVNALQGLADQAYNNQNNLFNMSGQLFQMDNSAAQYEASRGGGLKGAITGGITGAGAGLQMATGFSNMANATTLTNAQAGMMNSFSKAAPQIATNLSSMGANLSMQSAPMPSPARFGPSSPDALSRAGMISSFNYGTQFGPPMPSSPWGPQFSGPNPNANMYFNPSNFAK